jgi:hypothetical protein
LKIDRFLTTTDENLTLDRPIFNTPADGASSAGQHFPRSPSGRMGRLPQCGQGDRPIGGP